MEDMMKFAMQTENTEYKVLDLHLPLGISILSIPPSENMSNNNIYKLFWQHFTIFLFPFIIIKSRQQIKKKKKKIFFLDTESLQYWILP